MPGAGGELEDLGGEVRRAALPELAKVTLSGLAFANATSSFTEPGGNDGLAISTNGSSQMSEIGTNALSGSYGSFG